MYADNAMMAKAKALYGKRLQEKDYVYLLGANSLPELVNYLKTETYYEQALSEVRSELVHRGQLEYLLHREVLTTCLNLLRYSQGENLFLQVYSLQSERDILLSAIRRIISGDKSALIQDLPLYQQSYLKISLRSLATADTFPKLWDALSHTPYQKILQPLLLKSGQAPEILVYEQALMEYYYTAILSMVQKDYKGKARKELLGMFYTEIDAYNVLTIYRLKEYFSFSPERIAPLLLPIPTTLSPERLSYLVKASSAQEFFQRLEQRQPSLLTRYNIKQAKGIDSGELTILINQIKYMQARKTFRFSTEPAVVTLCYLTLLEIEIANIVHTIEGIRYQVPPGEIQRMLAYEPYKPYVH